MSGRRVAYTSRTTACEQTLLLLLKQLLSLLLLATLQTQNATVDCYSAYISARLHMAVLMFQRTETTTAAVQYDTR
jgi:hypothetical protein